jgi:hypothetical protein
MVDPTGQFVPVLIGAGILYFGSTGGANAPRYGDIIIPNNDGQIFDDAGSLLSGAARVCRPVFEMVKRTISKATDFPSNYKGYKPGPDETPREFADRVLKNTRYPNGGNDTGPRSDFNKLKKYGERYGK